jgi:formylglycine-generating enzyme required for sulfatase activity
VEQRLEENRRALARRAFADSAFSPRPQSVFEQSPLSFSPWALLSGLWSCGKHSRNHKGPDEVGDAGEANDAGSDNLPPYFGTIGDQVVEEGNTLRFFIPVEDPDGAENELGMGVNTLGVRGDPEGMDLRWNPSADQWEFLWSTRAGQAGDYVIRLTAYDGFNNFVYRDVSVAVQKSEDGGMGGSGGEGGVGGSDGGAGGSGPEGPICQVRLPVAVMYYDCVDQAATGAASSRFCASDALFGGDVTAARNFVQQAVALTQNVFVKGCLPTAVAPAFFFPDRVLDADQNSTSNEFWGSNHYSGDPTRLEADLVALGEDPQRFGAIMVFHGWDSRILPYYNPSTYTLHTRSRPPYALGALQIPEYTDVTRPFNFHNSFRHELNHAFRDVALHFGVTRFISNHTWEHPPGWEHCQYAGNALYFCLYRFDQEGQPLTPADWQTALGAVGVPVACDDPEYLASCAAGPAVTCGDTECPTLPRYAAACNVQGFCEYHRLEMTEPWHPNDTWIHIPAGASFMMGSETNGPPHAVNFAEGYFIQKHELQVPVQEECEKRGGCVPPSVADYPANGLNASPERADHPQNGLTQTGAWLACEGLHPGAQLPSEAQWEYAARGSDTRLYPFGNGEPQCSMGNAVFNEAGLGLGCGTGGTRPLGSTPESASFVGAMDMAGNLWERTQDCWHADYNGAPNNGSPFGSNCASAPLRGGGFNDNPALLQSTARLQGNATLRNANIGVRCALSSRVSSYATSE